MAIKVGINGFGRIGRVALRIMVERGSSSYQICGINLRNADLDYMVYQVKYDSVFRTFRDTVEHDDRHLIINGKKIRVYSESDITQIPWDDCGAEYIIESTGAFNTVEKASAHLQNGAKKVIISAPSKDDVMPTFVMGAKQKAVDARAGRDWRTGRSVLGNIIPSTTGAAKAVGQVIPELKGKMTGMSFRVPTHDVSVVDLTARLIHPASYHDVCVAMRNAAKNSMKGIITCTTDQVVSSDLTGFSETCIFDETAGIMLDDDFVKLIAWYDNEWGYTSKLLDLMAHMYKVDHEA